MNLNHYPVVCFGEILWDILPTGAVPGGAPMNVAYHLKKLGQNPALITRVGPDELGKELVAIMRRNEITTDFFQTDDVLATGRVHATIGANHEVLYEILKPVAWDNIQWDKALGSLIENASYFVFGSLASRNPVSRKTLFRLLEAARNKVLDINLRPPFYSRQLIEKLLPHADFLKLNLAELELITGWFTGFGSEADRIRVLQDRFRIPSIVVTRGGDGAIFNHLGNVYEHRGFKVQVADTVGSGDAFLAAMIARTAAGDAPEAILEFAGALGALVASYHGPCPDYKVSEITEMTNRVNSQ
jgi:fructokinase